jgi:hypothetical protein
MDECPFQHECGYGWVVKGCHQISLVVTIEKQIINLYVQTIKLIPTFFWFLLSNKAKCKKELECSHKTIQISRMPLHHDVISF